jgi:hypothetical protein
MIYKGSNFVDTSQVLNSYVFYRGDSNSPSFLQPRFAQTKAEEVRKPKPSPSYFHRQTTWVDSFAEIFNKVIKEAFGDFLTKWDESLSQLISFTKEEVNPSLEKPTGHSVFTALIYLFGIYQLQPDLYPDLAMSGDGGIYIEFQFENKFVSIQVNSESIEKDRIYIEQGDQFGSIKLTEESIKEIFTQ